MLTNRKVLVSLVLTVIASFFVVGCGEYDLPAVAVTAVAIDQGNQTLAKGNTVQLTATVTPSHASDKSVTWSSGGPGSCYGKRHRPCHRRDSRVFYYHHGSNN